MYTRRSRATKGLIMLHDDFVAVPFVACSKSASAFKQRVTRAVCVCDVFRHDDREIIGNTIFNGIRFVLYIRTDVSQHEKEYSGSFYIVIRTKHFVSRYDAEQRRFLIARNCDC